jgi:Zn-dependent protease
MLAVFSLLVLIFSFMIHEVSHGAVAYKLGDDTAKVMGRLNLNPLKHIDPVGSIFIPLFLTILNSPILFGWAKPVPYNPFNLKNPRQGAALIAGAGPLSNISIAVFFGLLSRLIPLDVSVKEMLIRSAPSTQIEFITSPTEALFFAFMIIIFINILLAVFNLVPIPPLDGSKILFALLPLRYRQAQDFLEQYGIFILLFFIFFGINIVTPIINILYGIIAGY